MSKLSFFYAVGGVCLVLGAVLPLFSLFAAACVFSLGALLFSYAQFSDRYEGNRLVLLRLRRQQLLGAFLLIVTAMMMFASYFQIKPFRGHEWMIMLLIATLFEVYTIFRIDHETKKEQQ